MKIKLLILVLSLVATPVFAEKEIAKNPIVKISIEIQNPDAPVTGDIIIELYPEKAPISVKNFLTYIESDFYTNTIFHRVINGFMVQGGGFTTELKRKKTLDPIKNEAENGLENKIGSVAMARTSDVDSATSQFFINIENNSFLNHRSKSPSQFGYCVFGQVIDGMDLVNTIKELPTMSVGYFSDVPIHNTIMRKVEILRNQEEEETIDTKIPTQNEEEVPTN